MSAVKKIFSPARPQAPSAQPIIMMPKAKPAVTMPTMNSPSVMDERRRAMEDRASASGRDSTNLTDSASPTYMNDVLGQ